MTTSLLVSADTVSCSQEDRGPSGQQASHRSVLDAAGTALVMRRSWWRLVPAALLFAFAGLAGCSHPAPTQAEVEEAVSGIHEGGRLSLRTAMDQVESVELVSSSVNGGSAIAIVKVTKLEADGSFGASCRNVLGCFDRVVRTCRLTLGWSGGWTAGRGGLDCE